MSKLDLSDLRRNYHGSGLSEKALPADPVELLSSWIDIAVSQGVKDANAMALGTSDKDGRPDTRIVLLKEVSESGITFFTNYNSEKGRQLEVNPFASCCLWWPEFERQIRISGKVQKVAEAISDAYFSTRPRESQISARASRQSRIVSGREELEREYEEVEKQFKGMEIPRPSNWGGYLLVPDLIEFWQGRPGRLHDRIRYTRSTGEKGIGEKGTDEAWTIDRLAP